MCLVQEEAQRLEHMVVEDHGPKKGMTLRLKPQFNPLFFPFATCLPTFSTPPDYDLKEGHNVTWKAHSQTSPIGRESNNNQSKLELMCHKSSTIDTTSTDPIQSELTSPWSDQWQLEEQDNNMTGSEDPWLDLEGMDAEEPDPIEDAPYATPWGLLREP